MIVGAGVVALSIIVGPPDLGNQADPTNLQAYPRPDWYFLWYFALLALIPPELESWVILGFPLLVLAALLALPLLAPTGERSPRRRPWALAAVGLPLLAVGVPPRAGVGPPLSPATETRPLPGA